MSKIVELYVIFDLALIAAEAHDQAVRHGDIARQQLIGEYVDIRRVFQHQRGERMIARAIAWLLLKIAGKEEREMLVRLYAGEIIMGRITEDDVPAKLKARVHKYLVDMGYFDDVEE